MGTASLVLGILAIIFGFLSPILGLIIGIIGIVLGTKAKKKNEKNASTGIVLSIIGSVISAGTIIIVALLAFLTFTPVNNTVENARKDTYSDVAQMYVNGVKNSVLSDDVECSTNASESANDFKDASNLGVGEYYIFIATNKNAIMNNFSDFPSDLAKQAEENTDSILEYNGKSAWANSEIYGWVHWTKEDYRISNYYAALTDELGHGFAEETLSTELKRNNVLEKDAKADVMKTLNKIRNEEQSYYCHINY